MMIDTAEQHHHLSLDNYADLLALAGLERDTGFCNACGVDGPAVPTDALWIAHDRTGHNLSGLSLLCARHAVEWSLSGHVVPAAG